MRNQRRRGGAAAIARAIRRQRRTGKRSDSRRLRANAISLSAARSARAPTRACGGARAADGRASEISIVVSTSVRKRSARPSSLLISLAASVCRSREKEGARETGARGQAGAISLSRKTTREPEKQKTRAPATFFLEPPPHAAEK